jgi:hypothetical protein
MESIVVQLRSACDEVADVEFRESYSGRGMYSRKCVGVVGSMTDCMAVIAHVVGTLTQDVFDAAINAGDGEENAAYDLNDQVQEAQANLLNFSYDSMGLDVIVYWPSIEPEPVPLPTDAAIDLMSFSTIQSFLEANEEYVTEDDDTTRANIRATAKKVRDRIAEDQQG